MATTRAVKHRTRWAVRRGTRWNYATSRAESCWWAEHPHYASLDRLFPTHTAAITYATRMARGQSA